MGWDKAFAEPVCRWLIFAFLAQKYFICLALTGFLGCIACGLSDGMRDGSIPKASR
jgi:hypothetical protein